MHSLFPSESSVSDGCSAAAGDSGNPVSESPVGLNVFMMAADLAYTFLAFCYANYASGSVVDFSDPGSPLLLKETSAPVDVRTAGAAYDVMGGGERLEHVADLTGHWAGDTVAVGIGCSVAVDTVLTAAGILPRHIERGCQLAVYRTAKPARSVGPFSPDLHVSARIIRKKDADRAIALTTAYPALHGGPIHVGSPEAIGLQDLTAPLIGDALTPGPDDVCMFWGCGVTVRTALEQQDKPWMANAEGSLVPTSLTPSSLRLTLPSAEA